MRIKKLYKRKRIFKLVLVIIFSFTVFFPAKINAWDENDTPVYKGSIPNPPNDPYFEYVRPLKGDLDVSGNLYVTDNSNNEIKVYNSDGIKVKEFRDSDLTGKGITGIYALEIVDNSYILLTSTGVNKVFKMDLNLELIDSWGGTGSGDGQFNRPWDIMKDNIDNIFVVDSYNHRIQVFDNDGNFTTKFGSNGSGDGQFNVPIAISIDSNNFIYIVDANNSRVQKFEEKIGGVCPSGGTEVGTSGYCFVTKWGTSGTGDGQFINIGNIDIYDTEKIIVSDNSSRLQIFDTSGNLFNKIVYTDGVQQPTLLNVYQNGIIYIGNSYIGLKKIDDFGNVIWNITSIINGLLEFRWPFGVKQNINNNIYVSDRGNYRIKVYDENYNYKFEWGSSGTGDGQFGSNSTNYFDFDNIGNIYIADQGNNRIQIFNINGNYLNKFGSTGSGNGQLNSPIGVKVSEEGCLNNEGCIWISDYGNHRIQVFNKSDLSYNTKFGSNGSAEGQFKGPYSLDIDSEGFIYIADASNNRIQKFEKKVDEVCPSGGFEVSLSGYCYVSKWGTLGTGLGELNLPVDVKVDGNYLYVSERYNSRIQKFDLDGNPIWIFGSKGTSNNQFTEPRGIGIDRRGDIFVVDYTNNRVQIYTYDKTSPVITLQTDITSLAGDPPYAIRGTATDDYSPVQFVQYQVDGTSGEWIDCAADDGEFDEKEEEFTCIVNTDIKDGSRQLYFRTSDSKTNEYITSEGYLMLPATGGEIREIVFWSLAIVSTFTLTFLYKRKYKIHL